MTRVHVLRMALAFVAAMTAFGRAAAPKLGEGKGQVTLSWDEFVKITGYDPARKGSQVLTIPWSEVEKLTGLKVDRVGKGASVDLPWAEFKALLEWSIKRGDAEVPPPTDCIVTSSEYTGVLSPEGASFKLAIKLNVLRKKGWKKVPVLPVAVALTKTTLPEGVFLNASGKSYELLTDKSGPLEIALEFAVSAKKAGGVSQVSFDRVLPGTSLVDLTVSPKDVDVKVTGAQSLVLKSAADKTHVAAAVPSNVPISISWERALPKVAAAPPKLYAETRTLVAVAEGMLLCQETVSYNILHSPVRELSLRAPAGASVLTVVGNNVQDWRVDKDGNLQVVLRGEAAGAVALQITYEQPSRADVEAPVIHPTGVERERGYVGVVAVANVEVSPGKVDGATGIDVRQLPSDIVGMTNQPILLAFRHLGEKFSIPLTIKKHAEVDVLVTIVDSSAYTAMQLPDGRRITKVIFSVRNNRNQFLRLKMPVGKGKGQPSGADIWSVSVGGNTVSPAKDEQGNVLIPLVRSARGGQELAAFPVEIVYVETSEVKTPAKGQIRVGLPVCSVPVVHVMYSYYVPAEGKYTVGWGESGFSGPLRVVEEFTSLSTGPGKRLVRVNAAKQAREMQRAFDARVDAQAKAAGATPIRVRLPVSGKLFRLEKILVLPNDGLYFELRYSGWEEPR